MSIDTGITSEVSTQETRRRSYRPDMLIKSFDTFSERIESARLTGAKIGPVTGFSQVDNELCGAFYPGLHVVTGNTGAGKTAFCLQIACQCGCPALYVTCEMSPIELLRRIAARVTDTPLHKFKNPACCISAAEMKQRARIAVESAPELVIADSTLAFWDRRSLLEQASMMRDISESEHLLIVIDSLHSWASWLNIEEYDRLNLALKSLRELASELECPVLYIAEQSKTANRANSKGQDLGSSAPAGFRGIEYGAETVIGLRAEVDELGRPISDAYGCTPVTLTFHKNRNGAAGKPISLSFDGALQRFEEI